MERKSLDEIFGASSRPQLADIFNAPKKNLKERLTENIQARGETINRAIQGEGEFADRTAVGRGLSAASAGFGALSETATEILPEKARRVVDVVGEKIGGAITGVADKIGDIEKLQELTRKYPNVTKDIIEASNIIADAGAISGEITGAYGAGAGASKVANVAKNIGTEGLSVAKNKIGSGIASAKQTAGDVIPSKKQIVSHEITRALDLTQGDVANILSSTANDVGQFVTKNKLLKATKEATVKALDDFANTNRAQVRDIVSSIGKTYKSVPRYEQALKSIAEQSSRFPGLEDISTKAVNLLKKKNIKLIDVQDAKELMDDAFNLYKATGDVSDSMAKQGLAQMRKEIKQFIEKEVKKNPKTKGVDIAKLNNNVSTAKSITNLTKKRSTRGLTRSNITLSDLGTFTAGGVINPLFGAALVFAKKVMESPSVRLRVAKFLDGLDDASRSKIGEQLLKGNVPAKLEKVSGVSAVKGKIKEIINDERGFVNFTDDISKKADDVASVSYEKYSPEIVRKIKEKILSDKTKAVVIDSDNIKKMHPEYDPANPSILHEESSRLSKEIFNEAVDSDTSGVIKLIGGGSGSGKSEVILSKIGDKPGVVFDGTMGNLSSAAEKIEYALSKGKKVEIYPVYTPVPLATLFNKMRLRSVPDSVLIDSHFGMRNTIPGLMEKYGNKIQVIPYENKVFDPTRKYKGGRTNLSIVEQMKTSKDEIIKANKAINEIIETYGIDVTKKIINDIIKM